MKIPDVFKFTDYLVFLQSLIQSNQDQRGFQTKISQKMNCQPATLSRALNGSLDLTRDQVANLCNLLKFDRLESEYYLSLYDCKTSSSDFLRKRSKEKLEECIKQSTKISEKIKNISTSLNNQISYQYYSSWKYAAVHILLMIPKFQEFEMVQKKLKIDEDELGIIVNHLVEWGLVIKNASGLVATEKSLHLDRDHPVSIHDHTNWRLKSIEDIQKKNETSLHYSSAFSISKSDADSIKKILLDELKKKREIIIESKSEEIYVLCLDFYSL